MTDIVDHIASKFTSGNSIHVDSARITAQEWSALLAHIQRGAVPEGDDGKRVLREVFALCEDTEAKCYEDPSDFNRGRSFEAKGIARAIGAWYQEEFCGRSHMGEPATSAPDHFRDAAEMVAEPADDRIAAAIHYPECWDTAAYPTAESALAEVFAHYHCTEHDAPAEVPMPEPDATLHDDGYYVAKYQIRTSYDFGRAGWRLDVISMAAASTYGAACRAAGEAAGYARGLEEAGRDAAPVVQNGEVLVTVTGLTGSGKSAIAGEIEIMCRALGLDAEWVDGAAEKHLTHADWTNALEMYRPRVRIVEANIPRTDAAMRGKVKP